MIPNNHEFYAIILGKIGPLIIFVFITNIVVYYSEVTIIILHLLNTLEIIIRISNLIYEFINNIYC